MNPSFWKSKKVLLTGHTGFKGSWLSLWLQSMGSDVIGFSKDIPTEKSHFKEAKVADNMESVMGDVRNYTELQDIFVKYQPEIVIHLAAQSIVHKSYEDPIETFSTNVMGTANLLDISRRTGIPKVVINVTSDKCYRNLEEKRAHVESDPFGGFDPYSSSKGCSEIITESFRSSFFDVNDNSSRKIGLASVRAGNVIGGGDWSPFRLVPDIIRSIEKNKEIKIRNPNAVRHWQYVLDPLNGYLMLAEKLWEKRSSFSSGWNFGPTSDEGKTVSWIIEKFNELWDNRLVTKNDKQEYKPESDYLILNSDKAKKELGWETRISTEKSIEWIIDWHKNYLQNENMKEKSLEQIENFRKMN